jgi:hypothetical protein
MLFPFVQLEFTHAIGPDPGRYVVLPPGEGRGPSTDGAGRSDDAVVDPPLLASADVLMIASSAARVRPLRQGLPFLRARPADSDAPPAEVPLAIATVIRSLEPAADENAARANLDTWRRSAPARDERIERSVRDLNRAIRAHRVAAGDPFVTEVTPFDARLVRLGYGTGDRLATGAWDMAFVVPRAKPDARNPDAAAASDRVAAVMRGDAEVHDAEDMVLRGLMDLEQGRLRMAAMELRGAVTLLEAGPREALDDRVERARAEADVLADAALHDPGSSSAEGLRHLAAYVHAIIRSPPS